VVYAQRTAVPVTQAVVSFDAGYAADVTGKLGTEQVTLDMMDEGTTSLDANGIAQARERLGASIGTGMTLDRTTLSLGVPSANLNPALDLFADIARNPAFAEAEVARIRNQRLAAIQQELTNPAGIAGRITPRIVAAGTPYEKAQGGGDPVAVAALTRADLVAFHQAWLRPEKAKIFVVSDRPLAEVKAALDARFGDWRGTGAVPAKASSATPPATRPRILLYDRPGSPQSLITGAVSTGLVGTQELLPVNAANDALGGSFLGRINMDLREGKHWSYGVSGNFQRAEFAAPYLMRAPVQADQTGPSIAALQQDVKEFVTTKPMTDTEFGLSINGAIRSASGSFETSGAVLGAMQQNDLYKRPDDYYATIAQRYRALTLPQLRTAIGQAIDPSRITWIVVGEAAKVKPQLDTLGMPVEVVTASSLGLPAAPAPAPATAK